MLLFLKSPPPGLKLVYSKVGSASIISGLNLSGSTLSGSTRSGSTRSGSPPPGLAILVLFEHWKRGNLQSINPISDVRSWRQSRKTTFWTVSDAQGTWWWRASTSSSTTSPALSQRFAGAELSSPWTCRTLRSGTGSSPPCAGTACISAAAASPPSGSGRLSPSVPGTPTSCSTPSRRFSKSSRSESIVKILLGFNLQINWVCFCYFIYYKIQNKFNFYCNKKKCMNEWWLFDSITFKFGSPGNSRFTQKLHSLNLLQLQVSSTLV